MQLVRQLLIRSPALALAGLCLFISSQASGQVAALFEVAQSAEEILLPIAIVAAATIMGYALYTVSPETVAKFGTDRLLLTLPFPIYGLFRYLYLVHQRQGGGSPADMLLNDRPLLACVLLWAISVVLIVYRPITL